MRKTFAFVSSQPNLNRGSYRIWIADLAETLSHLGHEVRISDGSDLPRLLHEDVTIILDKPETPDIGSSKRPHCLVGQINPEAKPQPGLDFALVGSVEEKIALHRIMKNIHVLPLIERRYQNVKPRAHDSDERLLICYHGNTLHLAAMASSGLSAAIDDFTSEMDGRGATVELLVITDEDRPRWIIGRPKVPRIRFARFCLDDFVDQVQSADIGIVPNAHFREPGATATWLGRSLMRADFSMQDYIMRFKKNSNLGRALVFMQLGVPVLCDLTPSHLQIVEDGVTGRIGGNRESFLDGLRFLADCRVRSAVSTAAHEMVSREFQPADHARKFVEFVDALGRASRPHHG